MEQRVNQFRVFDSFSAADDATHQNGESACLHQSVGYNHSRVISGQLKALYLLFLLLDADGSNLR